MEKIPYEIVKTKNGDRYYSIKDEEKLFYIENGKLHIELKKEHLKDAKLFSKLATDIETFLKETIISPEEYPYKSKSWKTDTFITDVVFHSTFNKQPYKVNIEGVVDTFRTQKITHILDGLKYNLMFGNSLTTEHVAKKATEIYANDFNASSALYGNLAYQTAEADFRHLLVLSAQYGKRGLYKWYQIYYGDDLSSVSKAEQYSKMCNTLQELAKYSYRNLAHSNIQPTIQNIITGSQSIDDLAKALAKCSKDQTLINSFDISSKGRNLYAIYKKSDKSSKTKNGVYYFYGTKEETEEILRYYNNNNNSDTYTYKKEQYNPKNIVKNILRNDIKFDKRTEKSYYFLTKDGTYTDQAYTTSQIENRELFLDICKQNSIVWYNSNTPVSIDGTNDLKAKNEITSFCLSPYNYYYFNADGKQEPCSRPQKDSNTLKAELLASNILKTDQTQDKHVDNPQNTQLVELDHQTQQRYDIFKAGINKKYILCSFPIEVKSSNTKIRVIMPVDKDEYFSGKYPKHEDEYVYLAKSLDGKQKNFVSFDNWKELREYANQDLIPYSLSENKEKNDTLRFMNNVYNQDKLWFNNGRSYICKLNDGSSAMESGTFTEPYGNELEYKYNTDKKMLISNNNGFNTESYYALSFNEQCPYTNYHETAVLKPNTISITTNPTNVNFFNKTSKRYILCYDERINKLVIHENNEEITKEQSGYESYIFYEKDKKYIPISFDNFKELTDICKNNLSKENSHIFLKKMNSLPSRYSSLEDDFTPKYVKFLSTEQSSEKTIVLTIDNKINFMMVDRNNITIKDKMDLIVNNKKNHILVKPPVNRRKLIPPSNQPSQVQQNLPNNTQQNTEHHGDNPEILQTTAEYKNPETTRQKSDSSVIINSQISEQQNTRTRTLEKLSVRNSKTETQEDKITTTNIPDKKQQYFIIAKVVNGKFQMRIIKFKEQYKENFEEFCKKNNVLFIKKKNNNYAYKFNSKEEATRVAENVKNLDDYIFISYNNEYINRKKFIELENAKNKANSAQNSQTPAVQPKSKSNSGFLDELSNSLNNILGNKGATSPNFAISSTHKKHTQNSNGL